MKKWLSLALILVASVLLFACMDTYVGVDNTSSKYEATSSEDSRETITSADDDISKPDLDETDSSQDDTDESSDEADESQNELEKPEHTDLYIRDYTVEQVLEYFEEVVLNMEYTDGTGDVTVVQKWFAPIYYRINGNPTDEDMSVLNTLFSQLNEISGFPGIYPASDGELETLTIGFFDADDFNAAFSEMLNNEDAYGAAQFWYYTATNEIYTANIGYRTDIDQESRTSVLLEEIVNVLGLSDTVLRTDSIVYQYSNDNTALSDMDWLILKLLYSSKIKGGMDFNRCSEIIKELYY